MSYNYNYKFWLATKKDIDDLLLKQKAFAKLKPLEDRQPAHDVYAEMVAQYVDLVNRLGYIYHRTFQVQKRELIKKLLEASSKRLIELRSDLKRIELNEFLHMDKTIIQRKLLINEINILRPPYFPYWRPQNIIRLIKGPRIVELTPEQEKAEAERKKRMRFIKEITPQEKLRRAAVLMIQKHERARVARLLLTYVRLKPDIYKPKPMFSKDLAYSFSHKPEQTMYVRVKRTKFEANYYLTRKDLGEFQYYKKPVRKEELKVKEPSVESIIPKKLIFMRDAAQMEEYYSDGLAGKYEEIKEAVRAVSEYTGPDPEVLEAFVQNLSAKRIQRQWFIYLRNREMKEDIIRYKTMLGMTSNRTLRQSVIEKEQKESQEIREKIESFYEEFQKACEDEKTRILKVKSQWIMEDISEHIRAWFKEFYSKTGDFHPYPEEFEGGTILLVRGETMDLMEFKKYRRMSEEERKKMKDSAKKEAAKAKLEKAKLLAREAAKIAQIEKGGGVLYDVGKSINRSENIVDIQKAIDEYERDYTFVDEKNNRFQAPYMDWLSADQFAIVHQELRVTVDKLMRVEYEFLKQALAKDEKKKYKAPKPVEPPKEKGGGKKTKDPTKHRTINSLYYEMLDAGIIVNYPKRTFEELIGDYNYCAYELYNYFALDAMPSRGEVKDVLREWILGMGPLDLPKPKSILIVGPPNSGKHQLCDILASEIDAVVMDLSPEKVIKYKSDINYLIHLVNKMSRILQPTIILIHGIHRVFWKKVPEEAISIKPTLMEKHLQKKILKTLKPEEKIIFIGTTDEPWSAKGGMTKLFEKFLLLPNTDYATSFILYKTLCLEQLGVPRDFEYFSPLAYVSTKINSGTIYKNITDTLSVSRRMVLPRKALLPRNFIDKFIEKGIFPQDDEELELYMQWYTKINKTRQDRERYLKALAIQVAQKNK